MVKLIGFEYRKHFAKPSILIALLVFSLVSIGKIYGIYAENSLFARGCSMQQSMQIKQLYWGFYGDFYFKSFLKKRKIQILPCHIFTFYGCPKRQARYC